MAQQLAGFLEAQSIDLDRVFGCAPHARPVMRFVDVASTFQAQVFVINVTRSGETLDGKSAMQMMLLEATQGCVIRIEARGEDAQDAVSALTALVESGFDMDSIQR